MSPRSFQSLYCARRGITAAQFRNDLLNRTLYPHARPFAFLLRRMPGPHLQADFEFIDDVAHLENMDGFHDALDGYVGHFSNATFTRRRLRLRISARRMWQVVREILPGRPRKGLDQQMDRHGSGTPFGGKGSGVAE